MCSASSHILAFLSCWGPSAMFYALLQAFFFFYSISHKYNSFQMLFDILLSSTAKTFNKGQRLELRLLFHFLCRLTVYGPIQCLFLPIPRRVKLSPFFVPLSAPCLFPLLNPPPPRLRSPYTLQCFMWMGVGVAKERMGKLATLGSHTHMHDACKIHGETCWRKITGEMLSLW